MDTEFKFAKRWPFNNLKIIQSEGPLETWVDTVYIPLYVTILPYLMIIIVCMKNTCIQDGSANNEYDTRVVNVSQSAN